jgi:DNA (cytosine-5-)-methyltransferase
MSNTTKRNICHFITNYYDKYGQFPIIREISEAVNLSSSATVHKHLQDLIEEGFIEVDEFGLRRPVDRSSKTAPSMDNFKIIISNNSKDIVYFKSGNPIKGQKIILHNEVIEYDPLIHTSDIYNIVTKIVKEYTNMKTLDQKKDKKFKTIDLFAGVGGIRLGFEKAGFQTVFANDFEPKCADTYNLNFKDVPLTVGDITQISANDIPECDIVLGGFPCQAFSIAGYRQGFKDEKGRGNLFFDVARIIEAKQPEAFLLENVKNLATHDKGNTFRVIKETLEDLGYHVKHKVLNSMEYGNVPQNRERIYIVGFKNRKSFEEFNFPEPIPLTTSILDILEENVDSQYYYNGKPLFDRVKNDITEKGKVYQWRRQYVRENKKGVCPTLTANMGTGGHNVPIIIDDHGIRKLTPRECFRIQGFPDTYKLPDISKSALYKQAGNSVSTTVIERIANEIKRVL